MGAHFKSSLYEFERMACDEIVGALTRGSADEGFFANINKQTDAWVSEVCMLKEVCCQLQKEESDSGEWCILLEYPLLRLEKCIDVILLANSLIFVIEFKVGSNTYDSADARQVEDYALALRDFHLQSLGQKIIPVLCSTKADEIDNSESADGDLVCSVKCANSLNLGDIILNEYRKNHKSGASRINPELWDKSRYEPVPTIIEAAQLLYAGHKVSDIARATADVKNLSETTDRLVEIIEQAQSFKKRAICFVTGVPGSGKTLTGLNAVHSPKFQGKDRNAGTFLSGNRPLVEVVREALILDHRRREKVPRKEAERKAHTQIQHIVNYLKEYLKHNPDEPPYEHAIVFDEAQRAWDARQGERMFGRDASEPELILRIMQRHEDWSVIIALVGGGQEINTGEAGLAEWGRALMKYPDWEIFVSPEVLEGGDSVSGSLLFQGDIPENLQIHRDHLLHLPVSIRSYRSEKVPMWVNAVLDGNAGKAREVVEDLRRYPVVLTRSLENARSWLRSQTRGNRRSGLIASSGSRRLIAHGLPVYGVQDMDVIKHWYLRPRGDVRSSYMLEVAINEYACQGLELDFVGMCWGGDFTRDLKGNGWNLRKFHGNRWLNIHKESTRAFLVNTYRVLLTRAREGLVIWVPSGAKKDPTRSPRLLDETAEYLIKCGVPRID